MKRASLWLAGAAVVLLGQMGMTGLPGAVAAEESNGVHLHEIGFNAGFGWGDLKEEFAPGKTEFQDDYEFVPIFLDFGFKINSVMGLENHKGTLQFLIEPFINPVSSPEDGVEVGAGLMMKYSYPFWDSVSPFIEAGAGPMYFGIDTYEQGEASFAFSDTAGAGLQIHLDDSKAINVGYRYRHISDLGIGGEDTNGGINAQAVYAGISFFR